MPHRRILFIALAASCAIALGGFYWWNHPALTATERQLVGTWTTPEPNPRGGYVTSKGPVTRPRLMIELRGDRSFRVWVISADDPELSILQKEGHWKASPGKLTFYGFGSSGDAWRELRERIRVSFGGSYVGRTSGAVTHSLTIDGTSSWIMTPPTGEPIVWKRRE